MSRHRHRSQWLPPCERNSNRADIRIKFKDGTQKQISIDKNVLNTGAVVVAFVAGAAIGAAGAMTLK